MPAREDPERRAQRILEAAGELILRWGYDKTTVDDIARQAGVAKGTIYLHWKTREELFIALVRHERAAMASDIQRGLDGDPNGVTLAGVIRQLGLALEARPLVRAFLLRDRDVVGKLLRQTSVSETKIMSRAALVAYLERLRERGLVRGDLTVAGQAHVLTALITGFLLAEPMMLAEHQAMDERSADLMADAVRCVLDPGRSLSAEERRERERATREYVGRVVDLTDSTYQSSLGTT